MTEKITKKLSAWLLCGALLLEVFSVFTMLKPGAAPENENLIKNPGFESVGTDNIPLYWEGFAVNSGAGTVSSAAGMGNDGSAAVRIVPTAGKQYALRQAGGDGALALKSGTYYVLSYEIKALSSSASLMPTVRQMNGENNSNANPWYEQSAYKITGTDGEWKKVSCYFRTDTDTTNGNIWLIAEGGEILLDNISLTVMESEGTLPNPHFERIAANGTPADWEAFAVNGGKGSVGTVLGGGRNGSAAARISPDSGSQYALRPAGGDNLLTLKSSKYYVLSYSVKAMSDTASLVPTIRQLSGSNNSNANPWYELSNYKITGTDGEWKTVSCYFRTDSNTTNGNIWLIATGGEILIDDISLAEMEDEGLIPNPRFERIAVDGTPADWEAFAVNGGKGSVGTVLGGGRGGSTAARISPAPGSQYSLRIGDNNMFKIKNGKEYILTYWVKCLSDDSWVYPTIRQMKNSTTNSNKNPWYDLNNYKITGTNGEWKKVEVWFKTDSDTHLAAIWMIAGGGEVLLDDMSLEEYENNDGLIYNPHFERLDASGIPVGWEGFGSNGGTGRIGSVIGAGTDGSTAAIISPADVEYSIRTPDDAQIPVKPKTSYVITYYVKGLSESSAMKITVPQYKSNGITHTAENPYYELTAYEVSGKDSELRQCKAYFQTAEDARYISLWFIVRGGDMLLDDVSLEINSDNYLGDISECNLSFEQMSGESVKNWKAAGFESVGINTETRHAGAQSVALSGTSLKRTATYTCTAGIPVDEQSSYRLTAYVKSRKSVGAKISIKAIGADKNRAMVDTVQGAETILSASDEYSDWTAISMKYTPAAGVTNVIPQISVSKNSGVDILIDDIRIVNLSEADYCDRFSAITEKGRPDDWYTSGNAVFTADGESLTVSGNGAWGRRFDELVGNKTYAFSGKISASGAERAEIRFSWYDYRDRKTGSHTETVNISTENEWTKFSFDLEVPSCTYAIVELAAEKGTVSFDDFAFKTTTADVVVGSDWSGFWIWYSEDYAVSLNNYRYFRDTFELSEKPKQCFIQMTADDVMDFWVNGKKVEIDGADDWESITNIDIADYLQKGKNVLAFRVINLDYECGLLYEAMPLDASGNALGLIISDHNTRTSKVKPSADWIKTDYTENETWFYSKEKGRAGINPWGIIPYDATVQSANSLYIKDFYIPKEAKGGKVVTAEMTVNISEPFTREYISWGALWKQNTLNKVCDVKLTLSTPMTEWPVGKDFTVKVLFEVPDFIPEARYTLQLDPAKLTVTNDLYLNNKLESFKVTQEKAKTGILNSSEVKTVNGNVKLYVNGSEVSPMMYYAPDTQANFLSEYGWKMGESGISLMPVMTGSGMNAASKLWTGIDKNGKNIYDFSVYDEKIISYIASNPNAELIVSFDASVPKWWAKKYPDEMSINKDGSTSGASFSSEQWKKDMKQVISDLIDHITTQSYAKYIVGFRVTAGRTLEWLPWSDNILDSSPATDKAFRKWLSEKYKTDAALQRAWNNSTVTLKTAKQPANSQMTAAVYENLLDTATQMQSIDYHKFLADATADAFTGFCSYVKQKTGRKWIVGGYFGYIWNAYSYEANGTLSLGVSKALKSSDVDYFCAPLAYDERQQGEDSAYQSMIDSLTANGKLYLCENDIRTVAYQTPYTELEASAHGQSYTMNDTRSALIREFSNQIAKGSGLWWYDMSGGWFNDDQIYGLIAEMQAEMTANLNRTRKSVSEVAVLVDEDLYAYMPYNFGPTYNLLYTSFCLQRQQLATMGAPYDIYYMSDLENGKIPDNYKVYFIMASVEADSSERAAIERCLKNGGKTVIWNYLPGFSDSTAYSVSGITSLTGFENLTLIGGKSSGDCVLNSTAGYCDGISGLSYGFREFNSVAPNIAIGDPNATVLGSYSDGKGASLAVKDMGDWTSIYSAVTDLPAPLLTNILKKAGVHIYDSSRDDILSVSSEYISVHARYGGKRTIMLPDNYAVYDVFNHKTVSLDANSFTFELGNNSTALFRLTRKNTVTARVYVNGKGGSVSPSGLIELAQGGSISVNLAPDSGYRVKSLFINDEKQSEIPLILNLSGIYDNTDITVTFEKIPSTDRSNSGDDSNGSSGNNTDRNNSGGSISEDGKDGDKAPEKSDGKKQQIIEKNTRRVSTTTLNWPLIIAAGAAAFIAVIAVIVLLILLLSRKSVIIMSGNKRLGGLNPKNGNAALDKIAAKHSISDATAVIKKRYVKSHNNEALSFKLKGIEITGITLSGDDAINVSLKK